MIKWCATNERKHASDKPLHLFVIGDVWRRLAHWIIYWRNCSCTQLSIRHSEVFSTRRFVVLLVLQYTRTNAPVRSIHFSCVWLASLCVHGRMLILNWVLLIALFTALSSSSSIPIHICMCSPSRDVFRFPLNEPLALIASLRRALNAICQLALAVWRC